MTSADLGKEPWKRGISLVQFNATFNKKNSFSDVAKVNDVKPYTIWIDDNTDIKESEGIMSVPTLILYENGKEVERWEAGISLKLEADYLLIQREVDKLTGANKF